MDRTDLLGLDEGATGAPRVPTNTNRTPVTQEELDALNATFDPITGMPLEYLQSDIPEVRQSFTMKGFTPGPYPKEFEALFGPADPNMLGYRIKTGANGEKYLEVQDQANGSSTYGAPFSVDPATGKVAVADPFNLGTGSKTSTTSTTGLKTDAQLAAEATAAANQAQRQSAYDLLYSQFKQYGLESLITPLKGLITSGASPSEFTIKLRETPEYKKRFAANDMRIANGFAAIDEATYLALEDKYQSLMQNYGLPPQMYAKGDLGTQEGFQKLIAGNVDPITAEERILEGKKLTSSTKQTLDAAKQFYPSLTDGDILAYVLDPKNALSDIKRKVTAAEIGGAQMGAGLQATAAGAEALAGAGVTGAQYQQAAPFISEAAQRGSELASFYGQGTYNQATAEAEALNLAGSAEAAAKRKKITSLATADFSGSSGVGALGRDKGIYGSTYGQSGLY
jgi:hypothetical protein